MRVVFGLVMISFPRDHTPCPKIVSRIKKFIISKWGRSRSIWFIYFGTKSRPKNPFLLRKSNICLEDPFPDVSCERSSSGRDCIGSFWKFAFLRHK